MSPAVKILILYLLLINLVTFIFYGVDKKKAREKKWRIPEKTLLLLAVFGGSLGAILGMRIFHHKTQHKVFTIGVPLVLLVQIALLAWLFSAIR